MPWPNTLRSMEYPLVSTTRYLCDKQKAYEDSRYREVDFPATNELVQEVISLPMHTELDKEQINFITKLITDLCKIKKIRNFARF